MNYIGGGTNLSYKNRAFNSALRESQLPDARPFVPPNPNDPLQEDFTDQCRLWSPECLPRITKEAESLIEDSACAGYSEDQSLAVLWVSKFNVRVARERLSKFRSVYVPNFSPAQVEMFDELMGSSFGKKFHLYRQHPVMASLTVKELVNYYYYQKQQKKRHNLTDYFLDRSVTSMIRQRLVITDKLKDLRFSVAIRDPEQKLRCIGCYKRRGNMYRAQNNGQEIQLCAGCFSHYRTNKKLANAPPVEKIEVPFSSPEELKARAGATDEETCTITVKARHTGLCRKYRREVQILSEARRIAPSAAEVNAILTEIDNILQMDPPSVPANTPSVITID
ncbi:hypothetical protein RvY_15396 [Ramazzottius varieornatus]|uniref:ELM2 domain-containing protein n=1 Tax=Ramazzottius varieornatus TaxID=947166 RepID=A0A1D1VUT1_RAMVA|nr:hypothetical protein RvY_15396 [Ramazzottius varieornatus]